MVDIVFLYLGRGLKCYQCSSTKDWDECEDIQIEVKCDEEEDQCFKVFFKGKKGHIQSETYSKGCTTNEKCKQFNEEWCKMKEFSPGVNCEVTWCTGDKCNAAALPIVSAIILIACACLAFLY